jgi:hypothetical protein
MGAALEVFVGYYRPFGRFDPGSVAAAGVLPEEPSDLSAIAWGATGHIVARNRLGFAAQLAATINSRVQSYPTPDGRQHGPTDATVTMGLVQAQFDVSPRPQAYHVWLNAGPGFVRHSGDSYRDFGSPTSLAAAIGATITVPIAEHWQLIADATTLFYAFQLPTPSYLIGVNMERGNQRDAMLHVGFGWTRQ